MCGINGIFDPGASASGAELERAALRMADAIRHRGPDSAGVWADARSGIAFGHRRLAIIDLTSQGHQPMRSESGRFVVTFNGEIYNFAELRHELTSHGHRFRGHSDTEVMLAAFEQWGVRPAVQRFNGMFAFGVWDCHARALTLGRDRLGEKPLYYGWSGGTLLFASELKALRAHPSFCGAVDRDALSLFMRYSAVPAPLSIYEGVRKLRPATLIRFTSAAGPRYTPETESFWSAREEMERGVRNPLHRTESDATDELDQLLREAVGSRMVSDVPLGAFLSGGIDSSTVVALMQVQSTRPIHTFSIGFTEKKYDEAPFARAVARHLGTDHTELYVRPEDALAVIPRLARIYDEPFADSSQIPTVLVSELARRHVTVSLSGDGGDEVFAGYPRYQRANDLWRVVAQLPPSLRDAVAGSLVALRSTRLARGFEAPAIIAKRFTRWRERNDRLERLVEALRFDRREAVYERLMGHWGDVQPSLVEGAFAPRTIFTDVRAWPVGLDYIGWMQFCDAEMYLPDDILAKVDRASMSVALEARVPLIDHRVAQYAWRLPPRMRIRNQRGKWLLRKVLARYVPAALTERPKMGFGVPIAEWLRGPLRQWAESLLDERRLRDEGLVRAKPVRDRWSQHLAGTHDHSYALWNVLIFEAWLDETRGDRSLPQAA